MSEYILYPLAFFGFACMLWIVLGWLLSDDIKIEDEDINQDYL